MWRLLALCLIFFVLGISAQQDVVVVSSPQKVDRRCEGTAGSDFASPLTPQLREKIDDCVAHDLTYRHERALLFLTRRADDHPKALSLLRSAAQEGHPPSQWFLGHLYATCTFVPCHPAKSILYYTAAASNQYVPALQSLAYRTFTGIGVPAQCSRALHLLTAARDKVMPKALQQYPHGHLTPLRSAQMLVDSSAIQSEPFLSIHHEEKNGLNGEDYLHHLQSLANTGEHAAMYQLGKTYYEGARDVPLNVTKAFQWWYQAAKSLEPLPVTQLEKEEAAAASGPAPPKTPTEATLDNPAAAGYTNGDPLDLNTKIYLIASPESAPMQIRVQAKAAGNLGWLYTRALAQRRPPADVRKYSKEQQKLRNAAITWFRRGAEWHDENSLTGLAMVFMDSASQIEKNRDRAFALLTTAAQRGFADAQYRLGKYLLEAGKSPTDKSAALVWITKAAQHGISTSSVLQFKAQQGESIGHVFAQFERAKIINEDFHQCDLAFPLYHRGLIVLSDFRKEEAFAPIFEQEERFGALIASMEAELGYAHAQRLTAKHLAEVETSSDVASHHPNKAILSYVLDHRCANQDGRASSVACGDTHYHLAQTDSVAFPNSFHVAKEFYARAAEEGSASGAYNLGWMYEHGIGVEHDVWLAKRYYDKFEEHIDQQYGHVSVTWAMLLIRCRLTVEMIRATFVQEGWRALYVFLNDMFASFMATNHHEQQPHHEMMEEDEETKAATPRDKATATAPTTPASHARDHSSTLDDVVLSEPNEFEDSLWVSEDEADDASLEFSILIAFACAVIAMRFWQNFRQSTSPQ